VSCALTVEETVCNEATRNLLLIRSTLRKLRLRDVDTTILGITAGFHVVPCILVEIIQPIVKVDGRRDCLVDLDGEGAAILITSRIVIVTVFLRAEQLPVRHQNDDPNWNKDHPNDKKENDHLSWAIDGRDCIKLLLLEFLTPSKLIWIIRGPKTADDSTAS